MAAEDSNKVLYDILTERLELLRTLDKEVPHGIAVDLERFVERDTANGEPIVEVEFISTDLFEKTTFIGICLSVYFRWFSPVP